VVHLCLLRFLHICSSSRAQVGLPETARKFTRFEWTSFPASSAAGTYLTDEPSLLFIGVFCGYANRVLPGIGRGTISLLFTPPFMWSPSLPSSCLLVTTALCTAARPHRPSTFPARQPP
jgi:hypothetical protein